MTPDERRARGTELCKRLAADVAKVAPPGLGAWASSWDIVAEASAVFWIELTAWEAAPSEPARLNVRAAYEAVLDAWREAAHQFQVHQQEADL
ncbi:MAG: hypothetical protein IIB36_12240 [Gemmatimonadetes bacterium]|nr:hypothetical protein [Gemmatimonadota bacterium]